MSNEELFEKLESVATFMRGMQFDPRIPADTKEALLERAQEIDELVDQHLEEQLMTCQGCEERRKWMKEEDERAKERMRLWIERLTFKATRTEQSVNKPSGPSHPDKQ